jgi:hypothetical protein
LGRHVELAPTVGIGPHGRSLRVTPCPPMGPLRLRPGKAGSAAPAGNSGAIRSHAMFLIAACARFTWARGTFDPYNCLSIDPQSLQRGFLCCTGSVATGAGLIHASAAGFAPADLAGAPPTRGAGPHGFHARQTHPSFAMAPVAGRGFHFDGGARWPVDDGCAGRRRCSAAAWRAGAQFSCFALAGPGRGVASAARQKTAAAGSGRVAVRGFGAVLV